MKNLICSILIVWFLIIQAYGDGKTSLAIPMENQTYCEMAIANIRYTGWGANPQYNCIDAGQIKI